MDSNWLRSYKNSTLCFKDLEKVLQIVETGLEWVLYKLFLQRLCRDVKKCLRNNNIRNVKPVKSSISPAFTSPHISMLGSLTPMEAANGCWIWLLGKYVFGFGADRIYMVHRDHDDALCREIIWSGDTIINCVLRYLTRNSISVDHTALKQMHKTECVCRKKWRLGNRSWRTLVTLRNFSWHYEKLGESVFEMKVLRDNNSPDGAVYWQDFSYSRHYWKE